MVKHQMAQIVGFVHEEDGVYGISFPDFPGCVAGGHTLDDVIRRGTEALAFHIDGMVEEGMELPEPRSFQSVRKDKSLAEDMAGAVLVAASLEIPSKVERINITMDKRLLDRIDRAAEAIGDNRSHWLAEAAKFRLLAPSTNDLSGMERKLEGIAKPLRREARERTASAGRKRHPSAPVKRKLDI
jgi:predicted RNase H-like HicB family nuclease